MKEQKTHHYFFSIKALLLATIVILSITSACAYLFAITYQDDLLIGIILIAPLIVLLPIALPDYIRFVYCAATNRPAVIISPDQLVDNMKGQSYKWIDIKEIKYMPFTGMNAPPGGYTSVMLKDGDKKIRIGHNSIRCKTTEFLQTLIKYHKQNGG